MKELDAKDVLDKAHEILDARGKQYGGQKERSMDRIIAAFNAITNRDLTEAEGWMFMMCLKQVRTASRPKPDMDDGVDMANYAAILEEHLGNSSAMDSMRVFFPCVRARSISISIPTGKRRG